MAITYIHPETGDTVAREPWCWRAVYNDGFVLDQFEVKDHQAVFHRFAEIEAAAEEHGGIDVFSLQHDNKPAVVVKVPANASLVHFYRHRRVHEILNEGIENEEVTREWRLKLWVIGFKLNGQYWLAYANEQGQVVYSADDQLFVHDLTEG